MLPNFFIVGAQKAATTSLHNYLIGHPDIYLPEKKETKFFIRDRLYRLGINYYHDEYFSDWESQRAVGEVDPDYMYYKCALDNIETHLDLKNIKFIFILRNPVDRAFSHYLMTYRRGLESLSFENAIEQEASRIANDGFDEKAHYSYVSRGFYLRQIEYFLSRVDRSQMLFLLTEDLKKDPESCLRSIYQFLDVSKDYVPENIGGNYHGAKVPVNAKFQQRIAGGSTIEKRLLRLVLPKYLRERLRDKLLIINQKTGKGHVLNEDTRKKLVETYTSENNRLEVFLGRSLQSWEYVDTTIRENK